MCTQECLGPNGPTVYVIPEVLPKIAHIHEYILILTLGYAFIDF